MLKSLIPVIPLFIFTFSLFSQENPFYAPGDPSEVLGHLNQQSFVDTNLVVQGVWSRINDLPKALVGVNSYYYSVTNKIFICGGADLNALPTDTCWWYDVASGSYQAAPVLPQGRWFGKLVRVKDNLYLVGSINNTFTSPDGIIFKYSLLQNQWTIADTMPAPFLQESAVCVLNDSLIYTIGGSINGYAGARNLTRIYNPALNTWRNTSSFPVNITTSHAELNVIETDTSIFVVGGYNAGNLNTVYRGVIYVQDPDTTIITWGLFGNSPFDRGVYRVAGAKWNDYMLFGPAMNINTSINSIWGLTFLNDSAVWTRFSPLSGDTAANISSFATVTGIDSNYFYLFGGFKNPSVLNTAQKYSFITPPPIGIIISNNIPHKFKLYQNYPNPFNPVTKIRFDLPPGYSSSGNLISLKIFDILGRLIAGYQYSDLKGGSYEIEFNGKNISSGVYFYKLETGSFAQTRKMLMIK